MTKLVPVILSGGSGTRLWPLSTVDRPKQFLPLVSDKTMLQETAARVGDSDRFAAPLVVCNEAHRFQVAEQLRATGIAPQTIILEPVARNTAPAIAAAASWLVERDPEAIMLVLPSDHVIADVAAFHAAAVDALAAAMAGHLVAFGLKPTAPETGYGYILRGEPLDISAEVSAVASFVEKPARETAISLIDQGASWNSGMFVLPAPIYLRELERLQPEIGRHSRAAYQQSSEDADFLRLDAGSFEKAPSMSVDHAVMEHTDRAAEVIADLGWSDVGSWAVLYELLPKDEKDNVGAGNVLPIDTRGCYLRSDGPLVAAVGVQDLVIVATEDAVLVVPRHESQRVREAVAALKAREGS